MRSYDFEICFINISITVQIIERDDSNIPTYAYAAVPVRTHAGHVILPRDVPCMRPCLGIVILVCAIEVPGTADLLVCGHAE